MTSSTLNATQIQIENFPSTTKNFFKLTLIWKMENLLIRTTNN